MMKVSLYHIMLMMLILLNLTKASVVYDFTYKQPKEPSMISWIYLSFLSTDDYCIGTPYQCEKIQLDPGTSFTIILSHETKDMPHEFAEKANYLSSRSSTFKYLDRPDDFVGQKGINCIRILERVKFGSIDIEDDAVYLANTWINEQHHSSIGLSGKLKDIKNRYFLNELYKNGFIHTYQSTVEIIDEKKGRVTFGSITIPSNYRNEFTLLKASKFYVTVYYPLVNLSFNQKNFELTNKNLAFDESFNFIQLPFSLKDRIYENYDLKEGYCNEFIYAPTMRNYDAKYFLCDKDQVKELVNTKGKEWGDLTFEFETGSLKLKKEDLFRQYDEDSVIFTIIFKETSDDPQWLIGYPILKYYMITKDFDKRIFTFYSKKLNSAKMTSIIIGDILIMLGGLAWVGYGLYIKRLIDETPNENGVRL